ncbi:MAG: GNAT family N-acetyltransferase [Candidatus Kryptoniota bacterium]
MDISMKPFSQGDTDQILDLWNHALPLDAITVDTLEARVLLDENFDHSTFLVAKDKDIVVGFVVGTYARRVPLGDHDPHGDRCWITAFAVREDYRRNGLATKMFNLLLEKFKTLGKRECYIATYAPGYFVPGVDIHEYSNALIFLKKLQFEEVGRPLSMDTHLPLFKVSPDVMRRELELADNGIVIRPFTRMDLLGFLSFLEKNMPADWVRVARANLRDITRGIFQPDQIFVAVSTHTQEIVGYCQYEGSHFGPFGVAEKHQGKGIGTVLLARTLERMRAKGYHNAYVLWTDDIAAKVYSKFGFKETRRFAVLRKSID